MLKRVFGVAFLIWLIVHIFDSPEQPKNNHNNAKTVTQNSSGISISSANLTPTPATPTESPTQSQEKNDSERRVNCENALNRVKEIEETLDKMAVGTKNALTELVEVNNKIVAYKCKKMPTPLEEPATPKPNNSHSTYAKRDSFADILSSLSCTVDYRGGLRLLFITIRVDGGTFAINGTARQHAARNGWIDAYNVLSPEEMNALLELGLSKCR